MSNLQNQFIKDSYQNLLQITSSNAVEKGDGTSVTTLAITSSTTTGVAPAIIGNTNNRILTATGGQTINGEANLTFDGSTLSVTGEVSTQVLNVSSNVNSNLLPPDATYTQTLGDSTHPWNQVHVGTSDGTRTAFFGEDLANNPGKIAIRTDNDLIIRGQGGVNIEGTTTIQTLQNDTLTNNVSISTPSLTATNLRATNSASIGGNFVPQARLHISGANNDTLLEIDSPAVNNILFVSGSGRIGIGTTTPITTLDVAGSINASGFVASANVFTNVVRGYLTASFGAPGIDFPTTAVVHISGASNDNLLRVSSPTNANILFVTGSGRVGIGTTSPTTKLDVSGSGNFTEDVYISGSLEFKGTTDNLYIAPSTDVRNWYLSNKNFTVSQEGVPSGIYFKDDGTRFYIIGSSNDRIYQYDLSTPWDVSTAVYNSVNLSVSAQDATPTDLFISPDGTILFVVGATNDRVYRYNLSSAWDISSATFLNFFSVASEETEPNGLYFDPTGTNMYVVGTTGDDVNQYTLGTAWDLTTASFLQTFSVASQETVPVAISFNNSGTRMYILGQTGDDITEYRLSTPWDISTATFFTTGFTSVESAPGGLYYNETYEVAYIVGSTNDIVYGFRTTPQLKYYGDSFIMDSQLFVGGRTEIGAPLYVNGGLNATTIAASSTLTSVNSSFSTSTISLGTGTSTATVNIGGNASLSSTNQFAYGAITSSLTKTVNIGTGGLTGSITNITIGSPLGGGKIILHENTDFTQNTTINQTLNVNNNSNILDAAQTASGAIVVYDTFTEASNTLLSSHTPNTGSGWSRVQISTFTSPTMTVFSATNTAGPTATVSDQGVIYRQDTTLTTPDYEVSVDLVAQDSGDDVLWLFARYQDVNNWYGVAWSTSQANCRLVRRVGGTFTNIATLGVAPITGATTLSIRVQNNLIVILNGGNVVMSALDTSITNAGYAAIGGGNIGQTSTDDFDATWKFDNFMVRNYVAGAQTSNIAGGLNISGINAIMTLSPIDPLPTTNILSASFATSGSGANLKPYFWNGSTWTALF